MALYVAACPDCFGDGLHQRSMFFKPVLAEAVVNNVVAFSEAIHEFDHRVSSIPEGSAQELFYGLPARTRTWNHRLGGGSYILFNYREFALSYLKVLLALSDPTPSRWTR